MRVFKDVNIIAALKKIVSNNTRFFHTDLNYDIETLKRAASGERFYWMSRESGTWLFNERDVHNRDTEANYTWQFYHDEKSYGIKAFIVEITDNHNNSPRGNIFEIDYTKSKDTLSKNSFDSKTVDVEFKPVNGITPKPRTFDINEFKGNINTVILRYGEPDNVRFNLSADDDAKLNEILLSEQSIREQAEPANMDDYIRGMVKERFHEYGYTQDDMAFAAPTDVKTALEHNIPAYVLYPNNTAEPIRNTTDLDAAIETWRLFGIDERAKRLVHFFQAGNTLDDLPFTRSEMQTIFQLALDKGKEGILDEKQQKVLDSVIHVLDTIQYADGENVEMTAERNNNDRHDEAEDYEQ